MPDRPTDPSADAPTASPRTSSTADDHLNAERVPLKQEGDALRDGSGSRHGQSPPNVDRGTTD